MSTTTTETKPSPTYQGGRARDPSTTYEGKHACPVCNSTEKYKDRHDCAPCHRARTNAARAKRAAAKRALSDARHEACGQAGTRTFTPLTAKTAPNPLGVPAPRQGQPFPYPVLTARLIATAPGSSVGGRSQKFVVSGESWDTNSCPCLWLWDEACAPGLKVGAAGFLVWEIRSAILPVANWYFVPGIAR